MQRGNYIRSLNGLRGFCIISVILFHAFPKMLPGGYLGVDIFFVISGYFITSKITDSGVNFSLVDFYNKRIRRIFPSLLTVLLCSGIAGYLFLYPEEFKDLAKNIIGGTTFTSNFIYQNEQGYFDKSSILKPLINLWSLAIEEQFYIIWPFVILILARLQKNIPQYFLILWALSFSYFIAQLFINDASLFYNPMCRFWEIISGALLSQLKTNSLEKKMISDNLPKIKILSVGAVVLMIAPMFYLRESSNQNVWLILPILGASTVIFLNEERCNNNLPHIRVLDNSLLSFMGLISFPLYLVHWPLISFVTIIHGDLSGNNSLKVFLIFISILISSLIYLFIEKPLRFNPNKSIPYMLIIALFILGLFGFKVFSEAGLVKRKSIESFIISKENAFKDDYKYVIKTCEPSNDFHNLNKNFFCLQSEDSRVNLKTYALIGDSHTYPMYYGFYDYVVNIKKQRLFALGTPGCPPLLDTESFEKGKVDECKAITSKVIENVISNKNITTIALVQRAPLYIEGSGFGYLDDRKWIIKYKNENLPNDAAYLKGLDATVNYILSKNKKIVIVSPPPELGFNPSECLGRPNLSLPKTIKECRIPKEVFMKRQMKTKEIIEKVVKKYKLQELDLGKALCDDNFCYASSDGKILYSDNNHLNSNGAREAFHRVAPSF